MRKVIVLLLFALFAVGNALSQIKVTSFRLLQNDLTANTHATMVKDRNGEVSALIKVVTSEQGFVFDGGMAGIVKTRQEAGEIWVYVPRGIARITVRHPQFGVLRDYYFPVAIEKARTYEMVLKTPKTDNDNDLGGNFFILHPTPKEAVVYVDGKLQKHKTDGSVSGFLPYGEHTYKVEATGYDTQEGTFVIEGDKVDIKVQLSSNTSTLTVKSPLEGGVIYLNDELADTTEWSGQLMPGMYLVELRMAGYKNISRTITLNEQAHDTLIFEMPDPAYGTLSVDSDPSECDVYLDNSLLGQSPAIFQRIRTGTHQLMLRKEGYDNLSMSVEVEEGKTTALTLQLLRSASQKTVAKEPAPKASVKSKKAASTISSESISQKKRSNAYWRSLLVPGWGDKFVNGNGRFAVGKTMASYGLIGAGVGSYFYGASQYAKYESMAYDKYVGRTDYSQDQLNEVYNVANTCRVASFTLVGAGAAVWLYDVIWVAAKGRKSQNTDLAVSFDPQTHGGLLSYSITF